MLKGLIKLLFQNNLIDNKYYTMYKIFKLINNCKFIYKNPKINDLVVLDIEGIEYLDNILKIEIT